MSESYKKLPQFIVSSIASIAALSFGILLSWSAVAGPQITSESNSYFVDKSTFSWIAAMFPLGGAITTIFVGWVRNKIGTKRVMVIFGIILTAGWVLITCANAIWMLMVGRLLAGFSGGAYCNIIPLYIGEISSKEIRGSLLSIFSLCVTLGTVFVYTFGYLTSLFVLNCLCASIAVFQSIAFMFLPESPMHLVNKSKVIQAQRAMKKLRGKSYDSQKEIRELQSQHESLMDQNKTFLEIFSDRATQKASVIMIGIWFFFQLSGISVFLFYVVDIFMAADLSIDPSVGAIIIGCLRAVGTIISAFLIERFGRKLLILGSSFLMTISLIAMGTYFFFQELDPVHVENFRYIPVLSLGIFIFFFSIGIGPISFVLQGELFSNQAKAFAAPIGQFFNFMLFFGLVLLFVALEQAIGNGGIFFMFAGFSAASIIFTAVYVKETKGKSLMEIQEMLSK